MANNGGRQGGGGGNQSMNEHVEFTVKAEEDLYLTGSENTILRVAAETNYSCLMLKTQRFSSLFRHYAKYHGLRKDDLEYYFVNPLENDDTPESVQLQRSDTIMVRKRRRPEPPEPAADDDEFFKDMRELLDDEEHMDAVFLVPSSPNRKKGTGKSVPKAGSKRDIDGDVPFDNFQTPDKRSDSMTVDVDTAPDQKLPAQKISFIEVRAHKCILTARAEYFKAHFRKSASKESNVAFRQPTDGAIQVESQFSEMTIRYMLEFVYTNRIQNIAGVSTDDLLSLLHLADLWLLRDLKRLVEHELIRSHMDVKTVARMYCVTDDFHARRLATACIDYIMDNIREVTGNVSFQEEMRNYPHLCIPVLKAAADLIPEQPMHKKQRTNDHGGSTTPGGGAVSSPVPDSDL
jgi:speckle-type POZ protein